MRRARHLADTKEANALKVHVTERTLKKRVAELERNIANLRDRLRNPMGEGYAPDIYSKDLQKILDGTYSEDDDE